MTDGVYISWGMQKVNGEVWSKGRTMGLVHGSVVVHERVRRIRMISFSSFFLLFFVRGRERVGGGAEGEGRRGNMPSMEPNKDSFS